MTPVAIVGAACIFPEALTIAQFWDNIVKKRNCITEVPPSRWRIDDYYDPDPSAPDKTCSRWGGFIPDVEFDPVEFGIPPSTLESTDVSQLLSLVVAKQALQDAGYGDGGRAFDRERAAVILGVSGAPKLTMALNTRLQSPVWQDVLESSGLPKADAQAIAEKMKLAYVPWDENAFPGSLGNVIAGRIANRLDFGSTNCIVDAACASSLAALRLALAELNDGQADMVLSGGVDADNSAFIYMCFSRTPALTGGSQVRPFDAESDGMLVGEGIGMMVLKRLDDAERDGDRIYAVIRGLGSSSDGRFTSIYAPRSDGQARALRRAYANAGVPVDSIGLIEAHGTGTIAGDLVEIGTLAEVFGSDPSVRNQVAVGSVKSQIGHTKAAAGAAGLLKTALALHHKVLPPTINVTRPNPAGNFGAGPVYVNTETRPWLRSSPDTPRRAGVSSFGFGGTNYHVVLEEYEPEHEGAYRLHSVHRPLLFAAASAGELVASCEQAAKALSEGEAELSRLATLAASAEVSASDARLGFVAASAEEAQSLLDIAIQQLQARPDEDSWEHPKGIFYRRRALDLAGHVVALFPGQGSQYLDMGLALAINFPEVRRTFARADELMGDGGLSATVFPPPVFSDEERAAQAERLQRTEFAQPAIGALSAGMFEILRGSGFRPDFVAGHSFGELTALWAAGALDDDGFLELAIARGRAMAPPEDPAFDRGAMLAVHAGEQALKEVVAAVEGLVLANVNAPEQVVLAGPSEAVSKAQELLQRQGIGAERLPVSAAFHSPLVAHGQARFEEALDRVPIGSPETAVFANVTAEPYPASPQAARELLSRQIVDPVSFATEIENIYAAGGRLFVEVGPRGVLTNLVRDILGARPHLAIALNSGRRGDGDRDLRLGMVQLKVAGLPLRLDDPYAQTPPPVNTGKSPASVRLNGANFVSEKTRSAYQQALASGHKIQPPPAPPAPEPPAAPAVRELELALGELGRQQSLTSEVHQRFQEQQAEQTRAFVDLLRQQQELLARGDAAGSLAETMAKSISMYHEVQTETLRAHQRYLEQQSVYARAFLELSGSSPAPAPLPVAAPAPAPLPVAAPAQPVPVVEPVAPAAAPVLESVPPAPIAAVDAPPPARVQREDVAAALLEVVSEKTGYPVDTLELDMDIEADLGIDSIKRVEILGALRERYPSLPMLKPAELGELRTLGAVLGYLSKHLGGPATPAPAPALGAALLGIVSEKTGYPVETLELGMDIEADLGIDSIKRVEILGALRERFPETPQLKPAQLGELRTLQQVVAFMEGLASSDGLATAPSGNGHNGHAPAQEPAVARGIRLKSLPRPDRLEPLLPAGHGVVVVGDGTPLTDGVVKALEDQGWPAAVLTLPASPSDADLDGSLRMIEAQAGPIGGCLYLHRHEDAPASLFPESEREALKGVYLLAKHLAPRLSAIAGEGRPFFVTVARLDGALGVGLDGDQPPRFGAVAGGLFGLVKTLNLEWPDVFCRGIDIGPGDDAPLAVSRIMGEIADPDRQVVDVAWGSKGRTTVVPAEQVAAGRS